MINNDILIIYVRDSLNSVLSYFKFFFVDFTKTNETEFLNNI